LVDGGFDKAVLLSYLVDFLDLLGAVVGKTKSLEGTLLVKFVGAIKLVLPRDSGVRRMEVKDIDLYTRMR
jgi:hypothetical protein